MKLKYVCDNSRHLICVPYSKDNLHIMAEQLDLKRCWFHKNHYDIPVRRRKEIESKCHKVSSKEIVEIIRSPEYAGLMYYENGKFTKIKNAPLIHKEKRDLSQVLLDKFYYKYLYSR